MSLKIGNLEAKIPLIQGGMGIGISLGGLAGAVAKAGGIGIISSAQIGFLEKDFDQNPKMANLRAMKSELEKARQKASGGIVGFNIMTATKDYADYVKTAVEAGADLIISGAGLPVDLPKIAGNTDTKLAPIVSTKKSAEVLLKYWDKKYQRMPDLIVIEGPKAGGHLGFSKEQVQYYETESYEPEILSILQVIHDYENRYSKKIPVAIAGGIDDRQSASRQFLLGADAIQVATRFIATEECDADIRYKKEYVKAGKEDVVLVKSPVGMPGRAIRNEFIRKLERGETITRGICHTCLGKCKTAEIPYCITDALINAAKGNIENALLFCGAHVDKIKKIETVKEVIDSIIPKNVL